MAWGGLVSISDLPSTYFFTSGAAFSSENNILDMIFSKGYVFSIILTHWIIGLNKHERTA